MPAMRMPAQRRVPDMGRRRPRRRRRLTRGRIRAPCSIDAPDPVLSPMHAPPHPAPGTPCGNDALPPAAAACNWHSNAPILPSGPHGEPSRQPQYEPPNAAPRMLGEGPARVLRHDADDLPDRVNDVAAEVREGAEVRGGNLGVYPLRVGRMGCGGGGRGRGRQLPLQGGNEIPQDEDLCVDVCRCVLLKTNQSAIKDKGYWGK